MANYRCCNGHTWEGRSRLSKDYSVADLTCPECGRSAESSLKRSTFQNTERKPRKGMRRGRGFAASKKQREKVAGLPCFFCGREASEYIAIDPAHLWPRGKGGCDSPDCVIPACREAGGGGCHRDLDEGRLEALPALISRGYWAEMAHPIRHHEVSPTQLVDRLTSNRESEYGEKAA